MAGHDFGGPVAAHLAHQRPDLVGSLVWLSGNAFPDTPVPFPLSLVRWPFVGTVAERVLFSRPSLRLMVRQATGDGTVSAQSAVGDRSQARWGAAEEIVSLVFLEAWRQRKTVTVHEGSLRPWLMGVTSNLARKWWRTRDRRSRARRRLTDDHVHDHAPEVASRLDDEERVERVLRQLDSLPAGQRDVLLLWVWEDLSYEEIAATLKVPIGTVRSRLNRARTALNATTRQQPDDHQVDEENDNPCLPAFEREG